MWVVCSSCTSHYFSVAKISRNLSGTYSTLVRYISHKAVQTTVLFRGSLFQPCQFWLNCGYSASLVFHILLQCKELYSHGTQCFDNLCCKQVLHLSRLQAITQWSTKPASITGSTPLSAQPLASLISPASRSPRAGISKRRTAARVRTKWRSYPSQDQFKIIRKNIYFFMISLYKAWLC